MREEISDLLDRDLIVARADHPKLASTLGRLARSGQLTVVLPGILARPDLATTFEVRVLALRHCDPDAILTDRAAARLGFWTELDVPTVTAICKNTRVDRAGFAFVKRDVPLDWVDEREGVRFLNPALAALDLCRDLGGDGIDACLRSRAATLDHLNEALVLSHGTRGQVRRRRFMLESRAEPWSAAERQLHGLLRNAELTGWRANREVWSRGHRYYLDVAFDAARVAVEVDGREFHGPETFESDRERQNALILDGWLILRITWEMLERDPDAVIEAIREALISRGCT